VFPTKKSIWKAACDLEKKHGTQASLEAMLKKSVEYCPQAEILWLIYAKEKWRGGDVPAAREVLVEAFKANPDSEEIWLAAAKLEWESDQTDRARVLLTKACDMAPSPKVFMKLALLERECNEIETELSVLDSAIAKYPTFEKYYMMAGQACEASNDPVRARGYYQQGVRRCPACIPLWTLAAALEVRSGGGAVKARSLLELARLKNPKNPQLWLAAVRLEVDQNNDKMVTTLMAKALQECPDSGLLWAEEIKLAARPSRRAKSMEALKRCDNDPYVIAAVASLFVDERKYPKARKWFDRAVKINETIGDVWAQYYSFELKHGTEETRQDIRQRCETAAPKYGEKWCSISKAIGNRKLTKGEILDQVSNLFETA
jgi:pre-mRNA-processing factor 6